MEGDSNSFYPSSCPLLLGKLSVGGMVLQDLLNTKRRRSRRIAHAVGRLEHVLAFIGRITQPVRGR